MPRYPERLLTADEQVVRQLRPHWRVLLAPVGALLLGAGLLWLTWARLDGATAWIVTGVVVVVALVVVAPPLLRWWFTQYVLTTERIVVRTGMVARSGTEIPLESISNVLFTQSVVERVLGYGDVLLESAGESGQSRLSDVPDPESFQSAVYSVREERSLHFSGGGGARDTTAQLEALADLLERGVLTQEEFAQQKARILDG